MQSIELFLDGERGIHLPQHFAQIIRVSSGWHGIRPEDLDILLEGPEHELYWEAWDSILSHGYATVNEHVYRLHQDGDLFLYCEEQMTEEEKENFFGV